MSLIFVKEKLERFGLLQSRNEKINGENLEAIVKYLEKNKKRETKKESK